MHVSGLRLFVYIPLTSNKANSSHKPTFFLRKKPTVVQFFWSEILLPQASNQKETCFVTRKILQNKNTLALPVHNFWSHLHFFKVGELMSKYRYLMLLGAFPDKVTPDIDFIDEAVVQCYVLVVRILFQVLVIYEWPQVNFDVNIYGGLMFCFWTQFCVQFQFLRKMKHISQELSI